MVYQMSGRLVWKLLVSVGQFMKVLCVVCLLLYALSPTSSSLNIFHLIYNVAVILEWLLTFGVIIFVLLFNCVQWKPMRFTLINIPVLYTNCINLVLLICISCGINFHNSSNALEAVIIFISCFSLIHIVGRYGFNSYYQRWTRDQRPLPHFPLWIVDMIVNILQDWSYILFVWYMIDSRWTKEELRDVAMYATMIYFYTFEIAVRFTREKKSYKKYITVYIFVCLGMTVMIAACQPRLLYISGD